MDRLPGDLIPTLGGLPPSASYLFDDRGRPDFRDVFDGLLGRSSDVAVAVTRVRLSTLDLDAASLGRLESLRVLVAELNGLTLGAEARLIQADPRRSTRVGLFRELLESGRLEIRSAPLGGWSPDFTVFARTSGPFAVLTGKHWFERPYPHRGPALAAIHLGDAARLASRRYGHLWESAHDVGPAVWNILSKAERRGRALAGPTG